MQPHDDLWPKLEEAGEEEVRRRLGADVYGTKKRPAVRSWLEKKERERTDAMASGARADRKAAIKETKGMKRATWVIALATIALVGDCCGDTAPFDPVA